MAVAGKPFAATGHLLKQLQEEHKVYRQLKQLGAAVALAISLGAPSAQAATEDLFTDNSTFAAAQFVGPFGDQGIINVFGLRGSVYGGLLLDDSNADFYSFDVGANQVLTLTVASSYGPNFGNDPMAGLFDPTGGLLAFVDDSGPGLDGSLTFTISEAGRYVAAVTGYDDNSFQGGGSTDFPYLLTIKSTAVPIPGAIVLLGSGLLGLAGVKRRRS